MKMINTQDDIDLQVSVYSLIEAVCIGFSISREESIQIVLMALNDKRLNILEIISEIYTETHD